MGGGADAGSACGASELLALLAMAANITMNIGTATTCARPNILHILLSGLSIPLLLICFLARRHRWWPPTMTTRVVTKIFPRAIRSSNAFIKSDGTARGELARHGRIGNARKSIAFHRNGRNSFQSSVSA
jgi:hypothetical protein